MRLLLIRHPRPLVAPGICYGSSDLAADPAHQAQVLAALQPEVQAALASGARLISSPLQRCAALAHALAERLDCPIETDPRLQEMDFGQWELRSWTDIARAEVDAWAADLVHYRPGGGENVLEVARRVQDFRAALQRQQRDAILICHAGTIRLLTACQPGLSLEEIALHAAQSPHHIPYGASLTMHI